MLEAYGEAISFLFQPLTLLLMLGAIIVGLIIGVIPGVGGMVFIALLLPMFFRVEAFIALTFLIALHAVVPTGGSISAILVGIPGSGPNAPTVFDGFPMNQKGQGARAIGAAVTSSAFGGFVPVVLALAMIPLVMPIVMSFRSPEMSILVLLGISLIAALTGGSVIKGLISGLLGILISIIGFHGVTAVQRFTFGNLFLQDGIGIVAVTLGIFGIGELLDMSMKGQATIAMGKVKSSLADTFQGAKDVWYHKWLWLRCTIIGYTFGVIPGVGGEAAAFVTYAQAKQISKHPERFGTGIIEGVIAPEAANNAKEAGSLLTTMAFGIPGSAIMAILLGAFRIVGVIPGPKMLVEHLPLAITLLLGIAIANMIGGIITFFAAPQLARVAAVRLSLLFPLILVFIMSGGFIVRDTMLNIVLVLILGVFGLLMKRNGYSRPALILGFVLGDLFEKYTLLSLKIFGPLFFVTPISLTMIAILVLVLLFPLLRRVLPGLIMRLKRA